MVGRRLLHSGDWMLFIEQGSGYKLQFWEHHPSGANAQLRFNDDSRELYLPFLRDATDVQTFAKTIADTHNLTFNLTIESIPDVFDYENAFTRKNICYRLL